MKIIWKIERKWRIENRIENRKKMKDTVQLCSKGFKGTPFFFLCTEISNIGIIKRK